MSEAYIDPYQVLGVARDASAATIKQAYFGLVRAHPPERDAEMFKRIRAAYERLRDPQQRINTDMRLLQPWPASTRRQRVPQPNLHVDPADVITIARSITDLGRTDWSEHHGKVQL